MTPQEIEDSFTKGIYSSRDLRLAHPEWLVLWPTLKQEFGEETGLALEISCTYRNTKAQNDLYQLGRTKPGKKVTDKDGISSFSLHNIFPSIAIDTWVHLAGKPLALWDVDAFDTLGILAKKYNLVWGGDWKGLKDRPHLELRK